MGRAKVPASKTNTHKPKYITRGNNLMVVKGFLGIMCESKGHFLRYPVL